MALAAQWVEPVPKAHLLAVLLLVPAEVLAAAVLLLIQAPPRVRHPVQAVAVVAAVAVAVAAIQAQPLPQAVQAVAVAVAILSLLPRLRLAQAQAQADLLLLLRPTLPLALPLLLLLALPLIPAQALASLTHARCVPSLLSKAHKTCRTCPAANGAITATRKAQSKSRSAHALLLAPTVCGC